MKSNDPLSYTAAERTAVYRALATGQSQCVVKTDDGYDIQPHESAVSRRLEIVSTVKPDTPVTL